MVYYKQRGEFVAVKETVAKRIRVARAELDISQATLAESLGVSPQNVAKWETGEINIGVDTLERIAFALSKDIEWFFQPFAIQSKKGQARRSKAA